MSVFWKKAMDALCGVESNAISILLLCITGETGKMLLVNSAPPDHPHPNLPPSRGKGFRAW